MRRDFFWAGVLWIILTVAGLYWVNNTEFSPAGYTVEGEVIDSAFRTMTLMAVPVFAMVMAFLGYAILRFSAKGTADDGPPPDGPHVTSHRPLVLTWLAVTTALSAVVVVNPGIAGMMELLHEPMTDVVVDVTGMRYTWSFRYPQYGITSSELVLPVKKQVSFEITSIDILHSFWIPAFRIKADAIPGFTTRAWATPTHTGNYDTDDMMRVQCSELCGLAHHAMWRPVRVVTLNEFNAWVVEKQADR